MRAQLRGLLLLLCIYATAALPNGVALTPPRGITTWLLYNFNVSGPVLEALADGVIDTGLAASG
jgi:hypothetical protein